MLYSNQSLVDLLRQVTYWLRSLCIQTWHENDGSVNRFLWSTNILNIHVPTFLHQTSAGMTSISHAWLHLWVHSVFKMSCRSLLSLESMHIVDYCWLLDVVSCHLWLANSGWSNMGVFHNWSESFRAFISTSTAFHLKQLFTWL